MSQATATRVIAPARNLLGSLRLPGDKSISHRYALLGGLAHGTTHLENFSTGADPASSLACVAALGAKVERDGASITIHGCGNRFQPGDAPLDCGNSGSTMRMLSGLLAGQHGRLHAHRRCLTQPPPHGAHPQTAGSDGRAHHAYRRPRAAHRPRRGAQGHRLHHARAQRAGKDCGALRRPERRRNHNRHRVDTHPRPRRNCARSLWRQGHAPP